MVSIDQREIETIRIFVNPKKRERYVDFLSNEKGRKEFASGLSHWNDFDPRRIAEDTCHVISELKDLLEKRHGSHDCARKGHWPQDGNAALLLTDWSCVLRERG